MLMLHVPLPCTWGRQLPLPTLGLALFLMAQEKGKQGLLLTPLYPRCSGTPSTVSIRECSSEKLEGRALGVGEEGNSTKGSQDPAEDQEGGFPLCWAGSWQGFSEAPI